MNRSSDLGKISGVGPQLAAKLALLNLKTVDELIHFFPRRYDDLSKITEIAKLQPGPVTINARIQTASGRYLRRGLHLTEALATDDSGSVRLTWFNQPYRQNSLKKDQDYYISGKYELRYRRFSIYNPTIELVSDFPINTARLVPRYPQTKGVSSYDIRRCLSKTRSLMDATKESLPPEIISRYKLISLSQAFINIHFPSSNNDLDQAKRRLGFEELFSMILASELNRQTYEQNNAIAINFDEGLAKKFVSALPFKLTNDQRQAIWRIYQDMAKSRPMNRLIEGDVGSGKTAVAAMAALMVINSGRQVAFMAPTELLARQHMETINLMFKAIGLDDKVGLLIGAMSDKDKKATHQAIKNKDLMFIIGTHALISEGVVADDLALVIIDEQHRFGVKQRQALKLKANVQPHMLALSATPIPRSLALTLFGELDISRLVDKPSSRQPILTILLSESQLKRRLADINEQLKAGHQAFIVSSSIDADPDYSLKSIYEWAYKQFSNYRVGLIHGRLKAEDKSQVMQDFVEHKLDVLVATTVIEVGIDVPNATTMLIFDAEHFGLAQLHQLRGRVGRGQHPGQVFLVYPDNERPSDRLRALESSNDGFKLAELDLDIRGPGAIYGQLQHGLLDLRMAGLNDTQLIAEARQGAKYFVQSGLDLLKYPQLAKEVAVLQKVTNLN